MYRALTTLLFVVFCARLSLLNAADVATAYDLELGGRYAEAIEEYEGYRKDNPVQAALGLARCYRQIGETERGRGVLDDAAKTHLDARVSSLQADFAFGQGDYTSAKKFVDVILKNDPKHVRARWLDAELHRVSGELDEAAAGYARLAKEYEARERINDADVIRTYGLAASRHARWQRRSQDFRVLVNDLFPSALQTNEHYWQAHVDTGLLFLEKYNQTAAKSELDKARAINPHCADVLAAQALLAMQSMEFETAETLLDRAAQINDENLLVLKLQADLRLASFQTDAALQTIEQALQLNPRDEESLGRKAAALGLLGGMQDGAPAKMQSVIDDVVRANPHCGKFFEAIGDTFDLTRKYPAAAIYYNEAMKRMPQLIQVPGKLGMVQMRLGEEGRAGELLEKSFEFDPFNVRVKNSLEVLDVLAGYAVIETEHFVIKFDRGREQVLAEHAVRYLEEQVYPEITQALGYEPREKSLFEIFSKAKSSSGHAWFSARMVGLPSIGTVGACAGKMVALASPNEMDKPFNWARVLKHEFVHVVNLQQTNFNIPHWYTEALAVLHEHQPRPDEWNQILARRTRANKLYNLDTINLAFARPRNFENWTLAYCQAELYAEFMQATYGDDALSKLLSAYADNMTTTAAIKECFDTDKATFEKGYREYVNAIVKELPAGTSGDAPSFAQIQRAATENPDDAIALASLARAYLARGSNPKARSAALSALKIDPRQQEAAYVLARLYLSIGEVKRAATMLDQHLDRDDPHPDVLALLAGLHLKAENFEKAQTLYEVGRTQWPAESRWLKALAKLHLKADQKEPLAEVLSELVKRDSDSVTLTKKLANLALKRGDFTEASKWANQSLQLTVKDAEVHALLGDALANQEEFAGAARAFQDALRLDNSQDAWRLMLADVYVQAKQPNDAKRVLEELLDRDPDFPGAKTLFESLDP